MQKSDAEDPRIILDLLELVGRDSSRSQRGRATEFDVAVGLVNSYLKYCVRKGYIKVRRIPARRYVYFLTPKGFAEKSRLTILLLSNSLAFFRQARADYTAVLKTAETKGWRRIALAGASELAEISMLCALETGITVIAMVDAEFQGDHFLDLPVVKSFEAAQSFDGVVITDRFAPQRGFDAAVAALGHERVLAPALLGLSKN